MQINPEFNDLKSQVHSLVTELAAVNAKVAQLEEKARASQAQTVWQLLATVGSTCAIIGTLFLAMFSSLEKRIDARFESLEKRIDRSEQVLNQRFEDFQKAQDKRFDDFKQEIKGILKK